MEGTQGAFLGVLQVSRRVELSQRLLDVLQEAEALFLNEGFVRHAHHRDAVLVHVVEQVVLQLKGLHRVRLDAVDQLGRVLRKVSLVCSVIAEHYTAFLSDETVENRHFINYY